MDVLNFTTRADRDRFDLDQPVDASTDRQSRHDVRRNVYRRVDATRVRDATRCVDSTSDDFQILHSASERDSWEMMNFFTFYLLRMLLCDSRGRCPAAGRFSEITFVRQRRTQRREVTGASTVTIV